MHDAKRPSPGVVKLRKRAIKWDYDRKERKQAEKLAEHAAREWCGEHKKWSDLRKLYRMRMPGATKAALAVAAYEDAGESWLYLTAVELGLRVELTFAEYQKLGKNGCLPTTILPFDARPEDFDRYRRERRNEQNAKRQKRARLKKAARAERVAGLDVRGETIFAALDYDWITVTKLMTAVGALPVWRSVGGRMLTGTSLRRAINREISALGNKVETKIEAGPNGLPRRFIRLAPR